MGMNENRFWFMPIGAFRYVGLLYAVRRVE